MAYAHDRTLHAQAGEVEQGVSATSAAIGPEEEDDRAFVRAVIACEPWAERELFDRYSPMVHSTLRRCLGPVPEIDDLMQEVFLRVFDRVKVLRDSSALRSFVYTIAIRVARTDIRRLRIRRRSESFEYDLVPIGDSLRTDAEARDALMQVQFVLDQMKAKHRIAFVLRYLDGLPVCEVARELEVSVATVNRWVGRAVQHISKEIAGDTRLAGILDREGSA